MDIIITNVQYEEFEGVNFITLQYKYKTGFGTLNIDDCEDNEFKINYVNMEYAQYNEDYKCVVDYINSIIKGKKIDEVLNSLRGV